MENEEFDWKEFTNLAVEYIDDNNPAKQRTVQNKEQELVGFIMGHFVHHETLLMKTKHT